MREFYYPVKKKITRHRVFFSIDPKPLLGLRFLTYEKGGGEPTCRMTIFDGGLFPKFRNG
jgi:hypothetical protein